MPFEDPEAALSHKINTGHEFKRIYENPPYPTELARP